MQLNGVGELDGSMQTDRRFTFMINVCPQGGCLPLPRGYIHVYDQRGGVMDSIFAQQSRGCGFETRLVHMPVMLVTNVHPDVIKANRP